MAKPYWLRNIKLIKARLDKILQLINNESKTVRNISYKLYPDLEGKALDSKYNLTIKDTVILRMKGLLPFNLIKESRSHVHEVRNAHSVNDFIDYFEQLQLSKIYCKNKKSAFDSYIEVWFEKDTVFDIFQEICDLYTIPMLCLRGKSQLSSIRKGFERFKDKKGHILYFADLDKSGIQNYKDIRRKFQYWGSDCTLHWCGITKQQLTTYTYVRGYRLDGFNSTDLYSIIDSAIQEYLDVSKFTQLLKEEKQERKQLQDYSIVVSKRQEDQ